MVSRGLSRSQQRRVAAQGADPKAWIKGSKYHLVRADRRYHISGIKVHDAWRYTAWYTPGDIVARDMLGTFDTPEAAKAAVEEHEHGA